MACAKPPEPGRATPPSDSNNFALTQVEEQIAHALSMIKRGDVFKELERQFAAIERSIERLRVSGAPEEIIRGIEGKLGNARGEGLAALVVEAEQGRPHKTQGEKRPLTAKVIEKFRDGVSKETAARAQEILTRPDHWAHETFRKELIRVVETAGKIPEKYKETLARDAAMLLQVCPQAGGLVTAMLTRGQAKGSFMRRFQVNSNDAVGAAYEIMGTAALCQTVSKPSNTKHTAPNLHIDLVNDQLAFGPKAFMNHEYDGYRKIRDRSRRTTEGDALLAKRLPNGEGWREIGIDFKHVKEAGTKGTSKDLRNQIEAVKKQIAAGDYTEFHFVSNGKFSAEVIREVDAANEELLRLDKAETEENVESDGMAKIAIHEYVTSIPDDPLADGEAS